MKNIYKAALAGVAYATLVGCPSTPEQRAKMNREFDRLQYELEFQDAMKSMNPVPRVPHIPRR